MILLLLIVLIGYCWFMVERWRWPAEETPFITAAWIITILYVSSLLGFLRMGSQIVIVVGLGLLLGIICWRGCYAWKSLRQFMCPGIVVFIAGFWFLWLKYPAYTYTSWDEFSHWGGVIKIIFGTNELPGVSNPLLCKDYPPAAALFQYFVLRFTGYSEGHTYFAQNLLILSGIVCLIRGLEWKRYPILLATILFGYLAIVFLSEGFEILYVDHVVGIFFGVSVLIYAFDRNRNNSAILRITPAVFCLPLIKIYGIVPALITVGIVCLDQVSRVIQRLAGKEARAWRHVAADPIQCRRWLTRLLVLTLCVAAPLLAKYSWQYRVTALNFNKTVTLRVSWAEMNRGFSREADSCDKQVINAFIDAFDKKPVGNTTNPSSWVSSKGLLVWFVLILGLYAYIRGASRETYQVVALHMLLLAGLAVYSFGILCVYLWAFTEYEAVRVASYSRYLGTYWLGWSFILYATYVHHWRKDVVTEASKQKAFAAVLTVTVLLMFLAVPLSIGFYKYRFCPPEMSSERKSIRQMAEDIDQIVPSNADLYLIWQKSCGWECWLLKYELATHSFNFWNWSLGEPYHAGDVWTSRLTPEAWSDMLRHYDFVVIGSADEQFWKTYGVLFKDVETSKKSLVFQIIPSADKTVQLVPNLETVMPGESIIVRDFGKTPQWLILRNPGSLCSTAGYVRVSTANTSRIIPSRVFKSNSELILCRDGQFRFETVISGGQQCLQNCENTPEWKPGYLDIAWSQTKAGLLFRFPAPGPINYGELSVSVQMRNYYDKQDLSSRLGISLDGGRTYRELPEKKVGYLATNLLSWSDCIGVCTNQELQVKVTTPRHNKYIGIDGIQALFSGSMSTQPWDNKASALEIENRTSIPLELEKGAGMTKRLNRN